MAGDDGHEIVLGVVWLGEERKKRRKGRGGWGGKGGIKGLGKKERMERGLGKERIEEEVEEENERQRW